MDMTFLKWPIIILVVVGGGWLLTEGGVNYMYDKFTTESVGEDADRDAFNESGLNRLGWYSMMMYRYEKAVTMYETSIERYPDGANIWMAYYNLARAYQKLDRYQEAVDILGMLRYEDADQYDERVPDINTLTLRIDTLVEVNLLKSPPMEFR